ncbi:MAG: hypothetical protein QXG05_06630 [Nitrososphaerota archaeon]
MLFSISSNLFSLQVVVDAAEEEQGAIEPLLLLCCWIEPVPEG